VSDSIILKRILRSYLTAQFRELEEQKKQLAAYAQALAGREEHLNHRERRLGAYEQSLNDREKAQNQCEQRLKTRERRLDEYRKSQKQRQRELDEREKPFSLEDLTRQNQELLLGLVLHGLSEDMADAYTPSPEEAHDRQALHDTIHLVCDATLPEVERDVVYRRFGIGYEYPMTFREIGAAHNHSAEWASRKLAKAMRYLRHPFRSRRLRDFL